MSSTRATRRSSDGRILLDLDQSLINRLFRAVNLAAAPFAETVGQAFDLSINDWRVLRTVAFEPGLSQQGVSDRSGLDKMTVSRAVDRLRSTGRIARTLHPDDRRKSVLTLTDEGWAVYDGIVPTALEREAAFVSALTPEEQKALSSLVDRLIGRQAD